MKCKKKLLSLLSVTLVCALLFSGCGKSGDTETVTLTQGSLETTVDETGTVVFDEEYDVTSLVGGKITSAPFNEGDSVKKGDVLYQINNVDLANQIASAKVGLDKANEAYRQCVASKSDLTLTAKASGLVTAVYAHKGDYVQPGTRILDIVESDYMKLTVPFSLPENNGIYQGMNAEICLTATGATVTGSVTKIYESSQSYEGGKRGTNIEIKIQNPGALKSGDIAYAKIGEISSISTGSLENLTEQTIVATASGEIAELSVREGDRIYAGTKIAQIKNDSITNSVKNAELNIKEIQTNISQLESKLSDYTITAPIDGVVLTKIAKESDIASPGTPLVTIADVGKLYVNTEIDEIYIKDLHVGLKTKVQLQNQSDTTYEGKVNRIDDSGIEKNGVTYYKVRIELENTDGLIEGMNVDVSIITGTKENAWYLPKEAVSGNKVTVVNGRKEETREVETGIKNNEYVEIISGLEKDDKVKIVRGEK